MLMDCVQNRRDISSPSSHLEHCGYPQLKPGVALKNERQGRNVFRCHNVAMRFQSPQTHEFLEQKAHVQALCWPSVETPHCEHLAVEIGSLVPASTWGQ